MPYTTTIKDGRKVVEGTYIPSKFTCKCKECKFTVQVPVCTTEEQITELIKFITK